MSERGVSRVSVSVPPDLLVEFDEVTRRMGYDRSKAIQTAMRNFVAEYKWAHEVRAAGAGALVMVYDHEIRDLEKALTDVQHRYEETIGSSMHIHLDERNCLEIIAVKGSVKEIRDLSQELMTKRGVKQVKLAMVTPR